MRFRHSKLKLEGTGTGVVGSIAMSDRTRTQILSELLSELRSRAGRLGIVSAGSEEDADLAWLASASGWDILRIGRELAQRDHPPTADEIETALRGSHVLVDCQVLFDPGLRINPVQLFRRLSRRDPTFACWPGEIRGNTFSYSQAGRPDHFQEPVQDAIVLRPHELAFPDELPFTIERI
jgi:hypothetical protein